MRPETKNFGKGILLFANECGGNLHGTVIVEGRPGNVVWNLIPIPQDTEENQGPDYGFGKPYRRSSLVGFKQGGR